MQKLFPACRLCSNLTGIRSNLDHAGWQADEPDALENGQVAAARARTAVSALFSWAMENGLAETNPTIGTEKPKAPPSRDRVLSDQELVAVWRSAGDDVQ